MGSQSARIRHVDAVFHDRRHNRIHRAAFVVGRIDMRQLLASFLVAMACLAAAPAGSPVNGQASRPQLGLPPLPPLPPPPQLPPPPPPPLPPPPPPPAVPPPP